ncbi:MAG TPA: 6,7-dimethyl-8-ribityllumazine synthase [Lentisphaeria bacterium]|nr:MAG: 6,7-dimethyl-8-ribityllumazine synthase [Lentisphaerae bacterium GWF2_49_21]HBC88272.1 6,7-dimethyl-8-ribityllumazine synthase [Lentisphaeria bacterium]
MNKHVKNIYEGTLDAKGLRIAIACARFNEFFVSKLLEGAVDAIVRHGGKTDDIDVAWVPGSYELPIVVKKFLSSKKYDAVIALGVVIQGATPHATLISSEVSKCVAMLSLESGIPVINGVINANDIEQAIERSGTKAGNKGSDAAKTAIEMANLMRAIPGK